MSDIRLRYPPSPTGLLHIGTVRTCLYNYLFARQNNGTIVMRMEDTDKERSSQEFAENIMSGLKNLGITWDEGPFYQSERSEIYRTHLQKLLNEGKAYYCFCKPEELQKEREEQEAKKLPPRYSGKCRSVSLSEAEKRIAAGEKAVIRFRVPEERGVIHTTDHVRKKISIHSKEIADFVIAKDLHSPLYNFCVVVDDHDMRISHVIRGEDHISNTPKQILISEAFGWDLPQYAHLPLILNADKSKLSKRKNKVSVDDYLAEGYTKEALINFLALIGWNTSDEQEIFSLSELIEKFSLDRVQKGGAIFDLDRLLWMNGVWIRQMPIADLLKITLPFVENDPVIATGKERFGDEFFQNALSLVHERTKKLSELPELLRFFFVPEEEYSPNPDIFPHKKMKVDKTLAKQMLEKSLLVLEGVSESDWNQAKLEVILLALVQELEVKNGQVLWPIRVALSGEPFSPGTFELLEVFGKKRSLERIQISVQRLQNEEVKN
jgi:glutamyl-tRNA synthetase